MTFPLGVPIWYVVAKVNYDNATMPYQTYTILHAIPCDIGDIEQMYGMYAAPLYDKGTPITTMIYTREPKETPITEAVKRARKPRKIS